MYEALSGRRAFDGTTPMRVLQAVVKCEYLPMAEVTPGVGRELAEVVERCLAKDLGRRYVAAIELAQDLRELAPGEAGSEPVVAASPRPPESVATVAIQRRSRVLVGAVVVLAFVLGLVVGWLIAGRSAPVEKGAVESRFEETWGTGLSPSRSPAVGSAPG